ncbi:MAG: hypothetical protein AAFW83_05665 [Pseudomonadota bacterium]
MMDIQLPKGVYRVGVPRAVSAHTGFPFGLGREGIHEVCECAYGDRLAALGFIGAHLPRSDVPIIAITQHRFERDQGPWHETGLSALFGAVAPILHVSVGKNADALWAMEEALTSGIPALVIAETDGADFTASRRLALASARAGIPGVLLLPYATQGTTAAMVRWRVQSQPSGPNPYDARAPGFARWRATAERVRPNPAQTGHIFDLEFDHETLSLNLVPELAPHTATPRPVRPTSPGGDRGRVASGPYRPLRFAERRANTETLRTG